MNTRPKRDFTFVIWLLIGVALLLVLSNKDGFIWKRISESTNKKEKILSPEKSIPSSAFNKNINVGRENAIVRASQRIAPSVVFVAVEIEKKYLVQTPRQSLYDFFWGPQYRLYREKIPSWGSGFLYDNKGHILTNAHVVKDAQKISVYLPDGRDYKAELVGSFPGSDVAVLKIRGKNLPVAKIGTAHDLMVGEWVIAIGNPLGLQIVTVETHDKSSRDVHPTVTVGVVSALKRLVTPIHRNLIQTDASINLGNSGGPLVNAMGEVVGMNTIILTGQKHEHGSVGLGFALPIDRVKRIANEILKFKKVRPVRFGFNSQALDLFLAKRFGLEIPYGLLVNHVAKDSPIGRAGLQRGDIILQIGQFRLDKSTSKDPSILLRWYIPGDKFELVIYRKGKKMSIKCRLQVKK